MDYGDGTIIHFWNVEQKIEYTITLISKHILSYHILKMFINETYELYHFSTIYISFLKLFSIRGELKPFKSQ